jgi:hypothetical protein
MSYRELQKKCTAMKKSGKMPKDVRCNTKATELKKMINKYSAPSPAKKLPTMESIKKRKKQAAVLKQEAHPVNWPLPKLIKVYESGQMTEDQMKKMFRFSAPINKTTLNMFKPLMNAVIKLYHSVEKCASYPTDKMRVYFTHEHSNKYETPSPYVILFTGDDLHHFLQIEIMPYGRGKYNLEIYKHTKMIGSSHVQGDMNEVIAEANKILESKKCRARFIKYPVRLGNK